MAARAKIRWRYWRSATIRFRQAGRRVSLEVLPHLVALRWERGSSMSVAEALPEAERSRALRALELTLVEVRGGQAARRLWQRLEELHSAGRLRFATPLLREPVSGLRQILTDEITVRWKQAGDMAARLEALRREFGLALVRRSTFVERQCVVRLEKAFGLATLEAAQAVDGKPEIDFAAANFISEAGR